MLPLPHPGGMRKCKTGIPSSLMRFCSWASRNIECVKVTQTAHLAQDLQFVAPTHTIRNRNRPAKQVGGQRRLNQHSMNRGSTRQSVPCAVSASPECLTNRGELHRLRTGSPAHYSRPRGPDSTFPLPLSLAHASHSSASYLLRLACYAVS